LKCGDKLFILCWLNVADKPAWNKGIDVTEDKPACSDEFNFAEEWV
jgi:hypothetical protein